MACFHKRCTACSALCARLWLHGTSGGRAQVVPGIRQSQRYMFAGRAQLRTQYKPPLFKHGICINRRLFHASSEKKPFGLVSFSFFQPFSDNQSKLDRYDRWGIVVVARLIKMDEWNMHSTGNIFWRGFPRTGSSETRKDLGLIFPMAP